MKAIRELTVQPPNFHASTSVTYGHNREADIKIPRLAYSSPLTYFCLIPNWVGRVGVGYVCIDLHTQRIFSGIESPARGSPTQMPMLHHQSTISLN
ncbi:hypothetical protein AVEN_151950-1 [Araneus ventricosus]|uniref:Uncharacterized protein n=1 Tax=Araneus ventricosus TaxID=182803 RepID=A0A4Y2GRV1_ARAVE|nr:hypothetical protein AVEN_151950-1 [Araneus ventricosus]